MGKQRIIIALGGNAILIDDASAEAQQKTLEKTAESISQLVEEDYELIISHGNGPQVGNLLLQQYAADSKENPALPLNTLVAMTQGSIGYWLQSALQSVLVKRGINKGVATVLTQVLVDKDDPAFMNPTKPIGPFLTKDEISSKISDEVFIEDAGRGWRKVVPSPIPVRIIESEVIQKLVQSNFITIAVGGGGIPVIEEDSMYKGVEAVIDKDLATAKLAETIQADTLLILTAVDYVYINYNKPNQKKLEQVTVEEMEEYIKENQFAPGSMLPKVEAAMDFVNKRENAKAIITSLDNLKNAMTGHSGTTIYKERIREKG
ncbi:MAG TPA: carbamate kinase [Atopostipes sp.]|nr:carbamate kinase [Atopostipes sp.]